MNQDDLRYAVAGVTVLLFAYLAARSAALRRSGTPVNQLGAKGNAMQRLLVALAFFFVLYLLARAPFPALDRWLMAQPAPAPMAAFMIIVFSAAFCVAAQGGMGRSWRVGVPAHEGDVEKLVTGGLNRLSRNPFYLGVMGLIAGIALAAPGPLTLAALALSFIGLNAIIASEEKYLKARFGAAFDDYARRVRRWI